MLSIKLYRFVFCLFRFDRNFKSLCFGKEPKQLKWTVSKQTKTNRNNPKFSEKRPKYALYHTVLVARLFVSVQSKHLNSLFRYRTETNVLFGIVPKLVLVPVLVVSNRNYFRRTPYSEGASGWSYAACLPYFRRAQTHALGPDAYRGGEGPLQAVLRIHDILVWIRFRIRIRGSMPLTNRSGSGFYQWPARCQQKLIVLKSFPAYYFLKVLLHQFSKIKSQK